MQTFLPYSSFSKSAACLDNKRLGKQRVEAMQILRILLSGDEKVSWRHHPAVLQWKGYESSLFRYLLVMCNEWDKRGFKNDAMLKFCRSVVKEHRSIALAAMHHLGSPNWLGNKAFHDSHKSRLLQKDKKHYKQFKWKVPLDLDYVWPVTIKDIRANIDYEPIRWCAWMRGE